MDEKRRDTGKMKSKGKTFAYDQNEFQLKKSWFNSNYFNSSLTFFFYKENAFFFILS